jgi:hypothetical protein
LSIMQMNCDPPIICNQPDPIRLFSGALKPRGALCTNHAFRCRGLKPANGEERKRYVTKWKPGQTTIGRRVRTETPCTDEDAAPLLCKPSPPCSAKVLFLRSPHGRPRPGNRGRSAARRKEGESSFSRPSRPYPHPPRASRRSWAELGTCRTASVGISYHRNRLIELFIVIAQYATLRDSTNSSLL